LIQVGLLGHGVIGRVHHRVLDAHPAVHVAFVADPVETLVAASTDRSTRGLERAAEGGVAHYPALRDALAAGEAPDLVVVATPTDTHLEVAGEALQATRAVVLSEKPLSRDPRQLAVFEGRHQEHLGRLRVVNHFAFSPEIDWGVSVVAKRQWPAPTSVFSAFNDPYMSKSELQRSSYVSSWVDSGSNQMSFLERFVDGIVLDTHTADNEGSRSVTTAHYVGGRATMTSNWWTGDSSKQTSMRWDERNELYLDHTSMTAWAIVDGQVSEHFGHSGAVDRKTAHYAAMYRAMLRGGTIATHPMLGLSLARSVTALLHDAMLLPPAPHPIAWGDPLASPLR
jgi:predicted dehydrogenase